MMKKDLLIWLAAMAGVGAVLYFTWVCLRDAFQFVVDWWQSRGIRNVRADREAREAARREENQRRLDNGCDHQFDTLYGALPPDVCCKCGMEKQKPAGDCDHTWKREQGLVPASRCEKCGKQYGGALAEQSAVHRH